MKRSTLQYKHKNDYGIIGISCNLREYRLCWYINKMHPLELERNPDIEIDHKKQRTKEYFCKYSFFDETNKLNYFLIGNKYEGSCLISDAPEIDYFMFLKGSFETQNLDDLKTTITQIPGVHIAITLKPELLKSQHIILE